MSTYISMGLEAISSDIIVLVFYIILTIVLILFGKFVGKTMYGWYWDIDPNSYKQPPFSISLGTESGIPEDLSKEARERAEDDGRYVGAWIGFFIGGVLSLFKAYNIYVKLQSTGSSA